MLGGSAAATFRRSRALRGAPVRCIRGMRRRIERRPVRPLQSALLIVFLGLCCLGLWWAVAGEGDASRTAPPLAQDAAASDERAADLGELAARANRGESADRADAAEERAPIAKRPDRDEASAEDEAARTLAGRVVDRAGRPVPGAKLFFAGADVGIGGSIEPDRLVRAGDRWSSQVRTAEADAEGRYELEDHGWKTARVVVRAPGFAPHRGELRRPARGEDYPEVVLAPGVILEGRVVDHFGRPVEGAFVEALPPKRTGLVVEFRSASDEADAEAGFVARTDVSGAFHLDQVEPGPYRVRARHPDAPPAEVSGSTKDAGERASGIEIRLAESAELRGRVVGVPADHEGGLEVVAVRSGGGFASRAEAQREAAVDGDGAFRLRGLPEGESFDLTLRSAGDDAFWSESLAAPARAVAGDTDVVLEWAGSVGFRVRVVDAATGAPIEDYVLGAGVWWLQPLMDEDDTVVESHPDGVAVYSDVEMGHEDAFHVSVQAEGYAPYRRDDVPAAPGEVIDLGDVRLDPVPDLLVRVLDAESGDPLAGARVALQVEPENDGGERGFAVRGPGSDAPSARTDESGVARIPSRPGRSVRLRVTHKTHAEHIGAPITLSSRPDDEHVVRLVRGGEVLVTVLDSAGDPLAGADVSHRREDDPLGGSWMRPSSEQRSTDAQGRVRFSHLAAGPHAFRLRGGGRGARMVFMVSRGGTDDDSWETVVVTERGEHELLLRAPARASLEGRLTENGRPLAGATLSLAPREEDDSGVPEAAFLTALHRGGEGATTDAEGRFRFDGEDVGPARLTIHHPLRAMPARYDLELEEGGNEVTIDLDVTALRGRVVDDEGRPVEGAHVTARRVQPDDGGSVRHEFMVVSGGGMTISSGAPQDTARATDADGRFELRGVAPGVELKVEVTAENPFLADGARKADPLRAGEVREFGDVELRRGGSVRADVRSATGRTLGPIEVSLVATGSDAAGDRHSESRMSAGEVHFDGLRPGTYRVTARDLERDGDASSAPAEATVEIGVRASVELLIP